MKKYMEYRIGVSFEMSIRKMKLSTKGVLIKGKTSKEVVKKFRKSLNEFRDFAITTYLQKHRKRKTQK